MMVKSISCPLCKRLVCEDLLVCETCGSLEGISLSDSGQEDQHLRMFEQPKNRTFGYSWQSNLLSPYVASSKLLVNTALRAANVCKGEKLIDLGCGDGRVCLAAARLGASAVGIDIDRDLISTARTKARKEAENSDGDVNFKVGDIRHIDLYDFDVVAMFLLPQVLKAPWFNQRVRIAIMNGSRILSFAWPVKGLEEFQKDFFIENTDGSLRSIDQTFYLYRR